MRTMWAAGTENQAAALQKIQARELCDRYQVGHSFPGRGKPFFATHIPGAELTYRFYPTAMMGFYWSLNRSRRPLRHFLQNRHRKVDSQNVTT